MDNPELPTVSENGASADLNEQLKLLVQHAEEAFARPSFNERNRIFSTWVGTVAGGLAAESLGMSEETSPNLIKVFQDVAGAAGESFRAAFDEKGQKIAEHENVYGQAVNKAGEIAHDHLEDALKAAGIQITPLELFKLLKQPNFAHSIALTAHILGKSAAKNLNSDAIREILKKVISADDYFYSNIDEITIDLAASPLSDDQLQALNLVVRLANATWLAGQIHRAAWEGKNDRINPDKKENFRLFDAMLQRLHAKFAAENQLKPNEAIIGTAFEVYKDMMQYQKFVHPTPSRVAAMENPSHAKTA